MKKQWVVVMAAVLVLTVAGIGLARREGLWTMGFKQNGLQHIIVQTGNDPGVFYYIVYEIMNDTGEVRTILPQARIVTETGQTLFATPSPAVAEMIGKKHGRKLLDITDMAQENIPNGESRHGVFVFAGLDDAADHLDITIYGISNEYKYENEVERTGFRKKVYELKLYRPGDEIDRQHDVVKVEQEGWVWMPVGTEKAPGQEQAAPQEMPGEEQ